MRMKRTSQMSIYEIFAKHKIADELIKISSWLDAHTEVLDWVEANIQRKDLKSTGRSGLTIKSILPIRLAPTPNRRLHNKVNIS